MIDYSITEEIHLFKVEEDYFTANYNGKIYSIGKLLFICLKWIKNDKSLDEITEELNTQYKIDIDVETVEKNIADFLKKLEKREKNESTLYNYIYLKVKIFEEKSIKAITAILEVLFNKYILAILTPTSILLTVLLIGLIYEDGILIGESSLKETFTGLLIMYGGITILGIFHEFGHASAAAYYKQPSTSIGFGFYIVFPVFYSDVSKIWNLDRRKRIIVNLGGIYFQLILNILFYILYTQIQNIELKLTVRFFVFANFTLLIYAINPFLRNDGYWVYSDFFRIPNLTQRAVQYPKKFVQLLKEDISFKQKLKSIYQQLPLLIYTLLFHLIMTALVFALIWLTYTNIIQLIGLIKSWNINNWETVSSYKKIFTLTFGLFINVYFFILIIKRFTLKNNK